MDIFVWSKFATSIRDNDFIGTDFLNTFIHSFIHFILNRCYRIKVEILIWGQCANDIVAIIRIKYELSNVVQLCAEILFRRIWNKWSVHYAVVVKVAV